MKIVKTIERGKVWHWWTVKLIVQRKGQVIDVNNQSRAFKMPKTDNVKDSVYTTMCPTEAELSVITNNILCGKCGLTFNNEPRYRMHDARVHKKITLEKTKVDNVRYHCPVKGCVYAQNSDKYFTMMKYIKQVIMILYLV